MDTNQLPPVNNIVPPVNLPSTGLVNSTEVRPDITISVPITNLEDQKPKRNINLIIVLFVALLLIVFFVAYLFNKNYQKTADTKNLNSVVSAAVIKKAIGGETPDDYNVYFSNDGNFQFGFPINWNKKDNPGNGFEFILANIQGDNANNTIHGFSYSIPTNVQLDSERKILASNPTMMLGQVATVTDDLQNVITVLPFRFLENNVEKSGAVIMIESSKAKFGITYMADSIEFEKHFEKIIASFKPL